MKALSEMYHSGATQQNGLLAFRTGRNQVNLAPVL
jgi:hypothetical protein